MFKRSGTWYYYLNKNRHKESLFDLCVMSREHLSICRNKLSIINHWSTGQGVYPIQIIIFCESEFLMLSSPNNSYNDVSPTDPSNDPSVPVEVSCQDVINSHHIILLHQLGLLLVKVSEIVKYQLSLWCWQFF